MWAVPLLHSHRDKFAEEDLEPAWAGRKQGRSCSAGGGRLGQNQGGLWALTMDLFMGLAHLEHSHCTMNTIT